MSMITGTTWVRRGVAAPFPVKYDIDEEEINRISDLAKLQLQDAKTDLKTAREGKEQDEDDDEVDEGGEESASALAGNGEKGRGRNGNAQSYNDDNDLKEYDLDNYDNDPVDDDGEQPTMFGNTKSLAYYQPHEKDPYLAVPENEDEDDEREELQILPTDNLLLAPKVEDEVAHMEVYVYEDEADNLYVHHDIMLPAIPLCTEWLDIPVGRNAENRTNGNFVAVGTMEPDIEVWDLDIVDCMYPNAILGYGAEMEGAEEMTSQKTSKKSKTKKKKRSKKANDKYHVDAVLGLAANRQHRNLLASASADQTVKLWDLNTAQCAKSYANHTDKVCSVDWHPREGSILLSGSYDKTAAAADMRAPDAKAARWQVDSDIEAVRWDPHDPNFFYITTESGRVYCHDVRNASSSSSKPKPQWMLQAHDSSVSSFDVNPTIPGFLATGSMDKQAKLWSVVDNKPSMVVSRNLDVGKVFSTTFGPDPAVSFRLAVAGSKGVVQVWDTSTNAAVRRAFASRVGGGSGGQGDNDAAERTVGLAQDDSSDSEDYEGDEQDGGAGLGQEAPRSEDEADGWESMEED